MLTFAVLLIFLALGLLWWASRQQQDSGIPSGRVIYADTSQWGKVEKPLYHEGLKLTGKPDYLIEQKGVYLPVEVKSGWAPDTPYAGHLYQLAAYCLLVEKNYAAAPPYGILHYRNRTFAIDYTPQIRSGLHDLIHEIRQDEKRCEVARSHEDPARCTRCGYRDICDQRL